MPSCGHCVNAAIIASWTASSADTKSRKRRATAPSTCGASSRNRCSEVVSHGFVINDSRYSISGGGPLMMDALQLVYLMLFHLARARWRLWLQSHTPAL